MFKTLPSDTLNFQLETVANNETSCLIIPYRIVEWMRHSATLIIRMHFYWNFWNCLTCNTKINYTYLEDDFENSYHISHIFNTLRPKFKFKSQSTTISTKTKPLYPNRKYIFIWDWDLNLNLNLGHKELGI